MTAVSTCPSPSCKTVVEGSVARCPACNRKMRTPEKIKRNGWGLAVVGLLIAGGIAYLWFAMGPTMTHPGVEQPGGATFTGTAEQTTAVFHLFAGLIAFGGVAILNGAYQIATGKRSVALLSVLLLMFAVVGWLTHVASASLG